MIQPGLSRITRLLATTPLPWRAIHVAGTNGKGSVCNYVASMLDIYNESRLPQLTGHDPLSWGKFTSPHLVDRFDGISVNGRPLQDDVLHLSIHRAEGRDRDLGIAATSFELLTDIAFQAFTIDQVDVGIVEVGMGGGLDATNVIGEAADDGVIRSAPLVTAIAKIGLDHQAFLGNTLAEIATHKAGIMKPGVPVVYDESNVEDVRVVLDEYARRSKTHPISFKDLPELASHADWSFLPVEEQFVAKQADISPLTHRHIQQNTSVALRSTWLSLAQLGRLTCPSSIAVNEFDTTVQDLVSKMSAVSSTGTIRNFGRLERRTLEISSSGRSYDMKLLLDGAHNAQSAEALAGEVALLRPDSGRTGRINWVIAVSGGRSAEDLLSPLLRPGDTVRAVEFGPVDQMEWVKPVPSQEVRDAAARLLGDSQNVTAHGKDINTALTAAVANDLEEWTVVAGSLYLVGDVHRLLRNGKAELQQAIAERFRE